MLAFSFLTFRNSGLNRFSFFDVVCCLRMPNKVNCHPPLIQRGWWICISCCHDYRELLGVSSYCDSKTWNSLGCQQKVKHLVKTRVDISLVALLHCTLLYRSNHRIKVCEDDANNLRSAFRLCSNVADLWEIRVDSRFDGTHPIAQVIN